MYHKLLWLGLEPLYLISMEVSEAYVECHLALDPNHISVVIPSVFNGFCPSLGLFSHDAFLVTRS